MITARQILNDADQAIDRGSGRGCERLAAKGKAVRCSYILTADTQIQLPPDGGTARRFERRAELLCRAPRLSGRFPARVLGQGWVRSSHEGGELPVSEHRSPLP